MKKSSKLSFLKGALKSFPTTGAFFPTSKSMSRALIHNCDFMNSKLIVELGVGTGSITSVIAEHLREPEQYLGIELNKDFYLEAKKKFPQLKFRNGSAENLSEFIQQAGHKEADFIVSALPWGFFKPQFQDKLLDEVYGCLKPGGGFSTIAYWGTHKQPYAIRFVKKLKKRFHAVELNHFVWRNIPPGYAYFAEK